MQRPMAAAATHATVPWHSQSRRLADRFATWTAPPLRCRESGQCSPSSLAEPSRQAPNAGSPHRLPRQPNATCASDNAHREHNGDKLQEHLNGEHTGQRVIHGRRRGSSAGTVGERARAWLLEPTGPGWEVSHPSARPAATLVPIGSHPRCTAPAGARLRGSTHTRGRAT